MQQTNDQSKTITGKGKKDNIYIRFHDYYNTEQNNWNNTEQIQ